MIGVKLFSAIAGIALVLAALLFLRHSMQQGWLQPPVRVLIGLAVAIGLLVVCELKAARRYPYTANALDAAAIAILFATFFAAHALWNLIPAVVTFALLAAVTALAVLLSIRRESMFIAVLGLLGGFATPALLSTGENRPIPLFAYLVLLNVGLAWVAYRQVWPVLTVLTLVLTTIYQWTWVYRFLSANDLSLALGIFAVFPVMSVAALLFGRRWAGRRTFGEGTFEHSAVVSAALPLAFVVYLAAVPDYGGHPLLLFGFLLLIDVGLLAIAMALARPVAARDRGGDDGVRVGGLADDLLSAGRLDDRGVVRQRVRGAVSVRADGGVAVRPAAGGAAPRGPRSRRPRCCSCSRSSPRIDPAAASPWLLFGPLLVLVVLCGWRASALDRGARVLCGIVLRRRDRRRSGPRPTSRSTPCDPRWPSMRFSASR